MGGSISRSSHAVRNHRAVVRNISNSVSAIPRISHSRSSWSIVRTCGASCGCMASITAQPQHNIMLPSPNSRLLASTSRARFRRQVMCRLEFRHLLIKKQHALRSALRGTASNKRLVKVPPGASWDHARPPSGESATPLSGRRSSTAARRIEQREGGPTGFSSFDHHTAHCAIQVSQEIRGEK